MLTEDRITERERTDDRARLQNLCDSRRQLAPKARPDTASEAACPEGATRE